MKRLWLGFPISLCIGVSWTSVFKLVVGRVHMLLSSEDGSPSRAYENHYGNTLVNLGIERILQKYVVLFACEDDCRMS